MGVAAVGAVGQQPFLLAGQALGLGPQRLVEAERLVAVADG